MDSNNHTKAAPKRFLIIDDEPYYVAGLKGILEWEFPQFSGRGKVVGTVKEAISELKAHSYDLVIVDLWFPLLELLEQVPEEEEIAREVSDRRRVGVWFCKKLREGYFSSTAGGGTGTSKDVPCLVLSAVLGPDLQGLGVSEEDCFPKPLDEDSLLRRLEELGFGREADAS